jgi:hypothetical protein
VTLKSLALLASIVVISTAIAVTSAKPAYAGTTPTARVICSVFGRYCFEALRVARCESGLSVYARNGQYFGLFQMGWRERARFGGSTLSVWEQSRAAYHYFRVAGGWGPWTCKP